MSFIDLCGCWLPLNRKERYYTATVLPAIICSDNFKHFGLFLKLLNLEAELPEGTGEGLNIQFFTEYSLKESIFDPEAKARFPEPPLTNEMPDIMILINGSAPLLIAIEAKMYDAVSESDLLAQMDRQFSAILRPLKEKWPALKVVHAALVPQTMKQNFVELPGRPIITWEEVHEAYKDVGNAHYFVEVLWTAISQYEVLKSPPGFLGFGAHAHGRMSGQEILDRFQKGTCEFQTMGRLAGLRGQKFLHDIAQGHWREQKYEVNESGDPETIGWNWFRIEDFVKLVEGRSEK